MAKCKWCERSGLLLKVSQKGLCQNCDTVINMDIENRARQIEETKHLILTSNNTDTIVSGFDFLIKTFSDLKKYEEKGIETFETPPSESLKLFSPNDRDSLIIHGLENEFNLLKESVTFLKTKNGRVNKIKTFYLRVGEFKSKLSNPTLVNPIDEKIDLLLQEVNGIDQSAANSIDEELEVKFLKWVVKTEAESKANNEGVAPYPYEQLANLYRNQKDYQKELAILARFSKQKHAPGVFPAKLLERLEKVKTLLDKEK